MHKPGIPANEKQRLAELYSYNILDSADEVEFNDIAVFAAQICGIPLSCISLIDKDRQWFKAKYGFDATETERVLAFCAHTILNNTPNIVNDATKDKRFYKNPFVLEDPKLRFYAGFPLITPNGFCIGTLAVIDTITLTLTEVQIKNMQLLAKQTMNLIELRKKNLQVSKSKTRYKNLLDNLNEGYFVDDLEGKIIFINNTFLNIFGLTQNDVANFKMEDYVAEEYLNEIKERHNKRINGEDVATTFEYVGKKKNGDKIWIRANVSKAFDGDKMIGTQSLITDITKEKETEEILNQNEQIISAYFNSDTDAVFILGKDLNILTYNKAFENFLLNIRGLKEIKNNANILEYILPKNKDAFVFHFNNCIAGKTEITETEIEYDTLNIFWRFTFTPIKDKNDTIIAVSFVGKDITLEKKLASEIITKDETILAAFNSTTDAVCLVNKDLKITAFNNVYAEIIQNLFNLKVSVGDNVIEHTKPEDRNLLFDFVNRCLNGEEVHHEMEVEYLNQPIYWQFRFFPIKSKNGEINGISYTAKNITDRRKLEQKNNGYNDLLEAINMINSLLLNFDNAKDINYSICDILVNIASFNMAWIGWVNEETQQVEPVSVFGDKFNYVKNISVYADDRPEGKGPIGISIRENTPQVVKNAYNQNNLAPWSEQRSKTSWKSSIAVPIIINSKNKGVLVVYSEQVDYFNHKEVLSLESIVTNYVIAHDRNELKKNILEKEYFLSSIANNAPALLSYWDRNLICKYANNEYVNWVGLNPFQMLGKHYKDIFGLEFYQMNLPLFEEVLAGSKQNFERKLVKKNGEEGYNSVQYIPHIIAEKVIGFFVLAYDITTLKQQEKRLKFDATILKNIHDAILISDLEGKMIYYNPIAENMFGYSQKEVLSKRASFIQHPEGENKANELYQEFLNGKKSTNIWRCKTKENKIIWLKISSSAFYNEENKLIGVLGTCIDITEQKNTEEILEKTKIEFNAILENAPVSIFMKNIRGGYLFTNKAFQELINVDTTKIKNPKNIFPENELYKIEESDKEIINTKKNVFYNFSLGNKELFTVKFPVLDKRNRLIAIGGIAIDITDKLEQEKLIEELHQKFLKQQEKEQIVKIQSLIEGQEKERLRISQELHDSIGQSLSLCKLYASSLFNFNGDEKEREKRLFELNEAIKHSISETRQISSNLMPPELKDFGLQITLENLYAKINTSNSLKINYTFNAVKKLNSTIEISIFRIIQEIINNTIKHSKALNLNIDIEYKLNKLVVIKTKDDGIGFALNTTKQGNGLNNIKHRVESILGEVVITSSPKKGCSYLIKIPTLN